MNTFVPGISPVGGINVVGATWKATPQIAERGKASISKRVIVQALMFEL